MRVSRSSSREGKRGLNSAGVLFFLFTGLAALLLAPSEAAAHQLHTPAPPNKVTSSDTAADVSGNEDPSGLETRAASAGLGGGCSLAALEISRHVSPPRVTATGDRLLPVSMKPARDLAVAPLCPPPTSILRVTLD